MSGGDDRPILLLTTVDIEDVSKELIVREGDDPREVARVFCQENGLEDNVIDALAEHLAEQIQLQEQEAAQPEPEATLPQRSASPVVTEKQGSRPAFITDSTVMQEQPGVTQSADRLPANKNKKKASAVRSSAGNEAFERLYAKAEEIRSKQDRARKDQELRVNQLTQSFRASFTKTKTVRQVRADFVNPGDRLYAEGVLRKKTKQEELAKAKKEEEEDHYKELCTFKPTISNLAQRLVSRNDRAAWERLHENARRKQEIVNMREEQKKQEPEVIDEEEQKECTFNPRIDTNSAKMMGDRTEALRGNSITVFDQLSQDALRRRMRLEEYSNWFPEEATFQPRILDASRSMAEKRQSIFMGPGKGGPTKNGSETQLESHRLSNIASFAPGEEATLGAEGQNIEDKLIGKGRMNEMKMAKVRASRDSNIDPTTGRRLFKPETGRPPAFGRDLKGMSVNQFLYERGLDAMRKKQEIGKMLESKRKETGKFVNQQSQRLLERLKKKRFRKIYEYLRQVLEQEGLAPPHPEDQAALEADFSAFLDENNMLLEDLDPEVKRDVDIVLQIAARQQEAHGGQVLLDEHLFIDLMEQVVQGPRDYLQPGTGRREVIEEFSFRPQINTDEESLRMVARRRPSHMKIYEILNAEKHTTEEKVQALKAHIEAERNRECSFMPETNKSISVPSRFMRPVTAPAGGVRDSAEHDGHQVAQYDDLEREVRMILEKHSAGGSTAANATDRLQELIGTELPWEQENA